MPHQLGMATFWPSPNSIEHHVLPPKLASPLRFLRSKNDESCDPRLGYCRFSAVFSVEVGNDQVLESMRAKDIFSYLGMRWLNECREANTLFFGLFFDVSRDGESSEQQQQQQDSRRLTRRNGRASGKCKGIGCPKGDAFTFPNRRLLDCDGVSFFNELRLYPDFASLDPLQAGNIVINTEVTYQELDYCDVEICWNEERYAVQIFLLKAGFQYAIDDVQHHCLWEGVHCNSKREISALFLRKRNLSGTIATELGKLETLENVDLAENKLDGTIPSELGQLPNLQSLFLNDNALTGSIPTELALLQAQGVYVTISGNNIVGDTSVLCPSVAGCKSAELSTTTPTPLSSLLPTFLTTSSLTSSPAPLRTSPHTLVPTSFLTLSPNTTPAPSTSPVAPFPTSSGRLSPTWTRFPSQSPTWTRFPSQSPTEAPFAFRMFAFLQKPVQMLMIITGTVVMSFFFASMVFP